jgi:hypothetical protein
MACGKLPYDWENEGKFMAYKVAYLKANHIPLILVMNNDQIGMVLFQYYVCVNHMNKPLLSIDFHQMYLFDD